MYDGITHVLQAMNAHNARWPSMYMTLFAFQLPVACIRAWGAASLMQELGCAFIPDKKYYCPSADELLSRQCVELSPAYRQAACF